MPRIASLKRAARVRPHNLQLVRGEVSAPEILLYDEIGFWGITAEEFRRELAAIDAPTIHLRINSPGGEVFDGMAIFNALREHPAHVITHIDGLAASMASIVALAADEVRMAENAFLMIHEPWSLVIGNAADLRKEAQVLDKLSGAMAGIYRLASGATDEQVLAWMGEETWFSAAEALDAGFAHEVLSEEPEAIKQAAALFDLSVFAHVPDVLVAAAVAAPSDDQPLVALRDDENRAAAEVLRLRLELAAKA